MPPREPTGCSFPGSGSCCVQPRPRRVPILVAVFSLHSSPREQQWRGIRVHFLHECNFMFTSYWFIQDGQNYLTCFKKKSPVHRKRIHLVVREEDLL